MKKNAIVDKTAETQGILALFFKYGYDSIAMFFSRFEPDG